MLFMAEICIVSLILHGLFLFAWFLGTVLAPESLVEKILFYSCPTLICQLHIAPTVSDGYNQNMGATITVGG